MITSERALRAAFWRTHPGLRRRIVNGPRCPVPAPQNQQPVDTRVAWVDFVDRLARDGEISDRLAQNATL